MWADLTVADPVEVTAVGFPDGDVHGRVRESRQIRGFVAPLSGVKQDRWVVQVEGGDPPIRSDGRSIWAGMSGAALFADGLLVGIVEADVDTRNPGRRELRAIPARHFAHAPGLVAWSQRLDRANTWPRSPVDPGDPQRMLRQVVDANRKLPVLDNASTTKIAQALSALQRSGDDQTAARRAVGRVLAMMRSKNVLHDEMEHEIFKVVFPLAAGTARRLGRRLRRNRRHRARADPRRHRRDAHRGPQLPRAA